ncbi:diguanylate cyclase [Proteobacteria bacterium 005FR1]|nr:diguanylate cyclase [Proteobacteria bacterium 005FR1]
MIMAESVEAAAAEQTDNNQKKAKVLVVDDSKLVRSTATKILSAKFDLVLAEDGEEAWEKICADDSIQVVFTDLGMPKLDGYGLIQRIRQSENEGIRNQPIIVLTGAAEEDTVRRKVLELGATDFITKPFSSTEIIARAEAHASYHRDKAKLEKSVDVDLLTGALNKAGLEAQLEKDASFVNRHGQTLSLIVFELDDFKTTYERIGKSAAEQLIKQLAATILRTIRKEDSIGRNGVARFTIILPMAKPEGVIMLAKRLCERINGFKMKLGGESLSISMSAGVSTVARGNRVVARDLLRAAEQALANAKKVGPGQVQLLKLDSAPAAKAAPSAISIDGLLEAISQGKLESVENQLEGAVGRLRALVALMSDEQKRRLLG